MQTVQKPRKVRKPAVRTARVKVPFSADCGHAVVTLTVGKQADDYLIRRLPSDFGTAFAVEKVADPDGHSYAVCLNGNGTGTCECLGYLRHGHCKHVEGLAALVRAGKLPAARKPAARSAGDLAANHPDVYDAMMADAPESDPMTDAEYDAMAAYYGE